jgi:uncharacterized membrane protein YkvA (DUF1232 family)
MSSFNDKSKGFFIKAKSLFSKKANEIAGEDSKLKSLLDKAGQRIQIASHHPNVQAAMNPILIFKRMINAHREGQYKISTKTMGLLVLGLLYFVTPIDLIPDFIPVLGYADDLSVVLAIFDRLKNEVDSFLDWEQTKINL